MYLIKGFLGFNKENICKGFVMERLEILGLDEGKVGKEYCFVFGSVGFGIERVVINEWDWIGWCNVVNILWVILILREKFCI